MRHECNSDNLRCYLLGECPAKEKCLWFAKKQEAVDENILQELAATKDFSGQGND